MLSVSDILDKLSPSPAKTERLGPIGLDFGMDSINLCQLKTQAGNRYSVVAKASIAYSGSRKELLSSPKILKKQLSQALKKNAFTGRKVVAVMPADELKITPVTYRSNTQSVDEEILKMLGARLDGELGDYLIDYLPVRSNPGDEEHLVLAAIAQRDDVMSYLEALHRSGLVVDALDIGPAALRRLICSLYNGKDAETILVINAGISKSYLTIISGRRLLFDQPVSFGEQMLVENLSSALELPVDVCRDLMLHHGFEKTATAQEMLSSIDGEDISQTLLEIIKPSFIKLVEEIKRVLIFTASETHGSPVSRICLLGSIARWSGADSLLHDLINIPLSTSQPGFSEIFEDQTSEGGWMERIPELAIATGLALRGISGHE
ncbi:MAG: pilus assembly protein PilM [Pseudomonadota bacterium]